MDTNNSFESITIPPTKAAVGSVIWLHGLGADGHDFADIVPQLALPQDLHLRFIFPHAPIRPITINAMMQMRAWYDIYSLTDFTHEDEEGIAQTQRSINQLIEKEVTEGVPSHRIVLAGFSQGGAMALYTSLRYSKPLAGVIALSTYLPLADQLAAKVSDVINQQIPIFIAHGDSDRVLPLTLGKQTFQLLNQLGYPVEWHEYAMGHQVCYEEIKAIGKWLTNRFS
ncbi:carboxylesterase [Coxiella-like endosymbiont of Rhipicephalus sanguineus]|uniref:alpha/beta hydrolase n=1 Tax=Coxiella-like endosymbiont of Rhipicephalus sanguineus TaxID=1955402 RepID=UPI00203D9B56|nr:alpha/beta fold hydrolase [Coxiella-like endosymbiont of Rhipicephalus sanguineus]MBT8506732.1 carboxylesterase [Coxiella-like endosymbiont of Rhipicephalus sanguineus]